MLSRLSSAPPGLSARALVAVLGLLGSFLQPHVVAAEQGNADRLVRAVKAVERERLSALGLAALDRFQETWNTRDVAVWTRSLHFPHVRPSAASGRVLSDPEAYIEAHARVFENVLALGWHRSQWDTRQVLHLSHDKLHIAGQYTRRRENGEKISSQQVTYIVTRQGEKWGIQSRFGTGKIDAGSHVPDTAQPARRAVVRYFEAFNSLDPRAWADTLHYPQIRLSLSGLDSWNSREEFLAGTEPGRQRAWFKTELEQADPVQTGADGANVVVRYRRLNAEKETLSTYDAVYLVTRDQGGKWAVRARSTYAP